MVRNVTLKYPNDTLLNIYKLCSYEIKSLQKNYLIYTLNETEGKNVIVYFGQLTSQENELYMETVKNEDLEEFKKFLVLFANGTLKKEDSNYIPTSLDLEYKTITITGGSKTKMHASTIQPYLHGMETVEEIEELNLEDDLEVIPAKEVSVVEQAPIDEATKEMTEEVTSTEQAVETVETQESEPQVSSTKEEVVEPTPVLEKKEKKKNPFLTILIILLVLAVISGCTFLGYLWIKENNRKADEEGPNIEDQMKMTLEQIGQKVGTSSFKQELFDQGAELMVSTTSSELIFKITGEVNIEYHFSLKGTTLSITIPSEDEIGQKLTYHTYAAIQELLGNKKEEAYRYITSNTDHVTFSQDGIAILKQNNNWDIRISTSQKVEFNDSDITGPLTESLFETHQENLTTEDALMLQYSNISLIKKMTETLDVTIIEKEKLDENAYQSFLNYLKVAFDEETMNAFKEDYSGFELGKMELKNYTIVFDEPLDSGYESLYPSSTYKWVTIKINKDLLK